MERKGFLRKSSEYCTCNGGVLTTGFEDEWGYWDVCSKCGKRIEDGHHFYNHYDGEDHEEFWTANGDIETDRDDD